MKIRYLLKKRGNKKGAAHPVYLALYDNDLTEIIFSGHRIALTEWSTKDRSPKDHSGEVSKALGKLKGDVGRAILRLEAAEKPVTPFTVKEEFTRKQIEQVNSQAQNDKKAKLGLMTVARLAERYIENELFRLKTSSQKTVTESINQFTTYLKISGLLTLERKDLDSNVISGYDRYLLEKKKLADSTHGKRMKHLKWFLKHIGHSTDGIKIRSFKKQIISLSLTELTALENVDVSFSSEMQKAKDLFLLGCYTGLRISDLRRINATNYRDGHIELNLLKNNRNVKIPVSQSAAQIIARYGTRAPKLAEQILNREIKEVCKKAGITQRIMVDTTQAGKRISKAQSKHELISSHTAGKTFISLAPEKYGLSPAEIAAIVGKDLKTLLNNYFSLPGESARKKMLEVESGKMKVA